MLPFLLAGVFIFGVAQSLPVLDETVSDGQIIVVREGQYRLSREAYEANVVGVLASGAAVVLDADVPGKQTVASSGVAKVTVNGQSGPISVGDFVTASDVPGIGMKATTSGWVLGAAQEAFGGATAEEVGQVEVLLNPHLATLSGEPAGAAHLSGLIADFLNISAAGIQDEPSTALRWAVATLILVISLAASLLVFGRVAANGIMAIGRNPLAKGAIAFTVGLNLAITLMILGVGAGLSYLVLAL